MHKFRKQWPYPSSKRIALEALEWPETQQDLQLKDKVDVLWCFCMYGLAPSCGQICNTALQALALHSDLIQWSGHADESTNNIRHAAWSYRLIGYMSWTHGIWAFLWTVTCRWITISHIHTTKLALQQFGSDTKASEGEQLGKGSYISQWKHPESS